MSKPPFSCRPSSSVNSTSENVPEHEPVRASRPLAIADSTPQLKRVLSRASRADVQPGSSFQSVMPSPSLSLPSEHCATAAGGLAARTAGSAARFFASPSSISAIAFSSS